MTSRTSGLLFGVSAYLMWGFMPLYFQPLEGRVDVGVILAHRIAWSVLLLVLLLTVFGGWGGVLATVRAPRTLGMLAASTLLLSVNWYTFTWAVTHGQATQAALGYFLNPLLTAMLAMLFLKERFRTLQWAALAIAAAGVTVLAVGSGEVPVAALLLAASWGLYGLLRKLAPVDAVVGLAVETLLLLPWVALFLAYAFDAGLPGATWDLPLLAYLAISGVLTSVPLLCFARAARQLRLSTLGFLQYIGPTCQLLCAVLVFGEPFTPLRMLTFSLIWAAVALFLFDAIRNSYFGRALADEPA